jgi:hypothetical protein
VQTDTRPVPPPFTWPTLLGSIVLGVVVGAVGTVMHRATRPWGLVLCLVLVASAALVARAWGGRRAWAGYVVAASATVWLLSTQGPGGDVLVPAHQAIGWVWIFGVPVVAILVALLPAALFDDRLRPPRAGHEAAVEAPAAPWPPASGSVAQAQPDLPATPGRGPAIPPGTSEDGA